MSKEYRIPKNIKPQDLVRGIINASFWHWNTIDKTQHNEAITYLNNLESIDNANPSEALKIITICESSNYLNTWYPKFVEDLKTIKQYILKSQEQEKEIDRIENQCLDLISDNIRLKNKAQEQEKVLEIIKELKRFGDNINDILEYDTYEDYINSKWDWGYELTQEEFDLLKRWV